MFLNNKKRIKEILLYSKESNWANVFHDSIRGQDCLTNLPLNIGRWAGSYSFFYVLSRILKDYKPESVLELGLGESTKFISTFLDNYLPNTKHIVVEHDTAWIELFNEKFKLSNKSKIVCCDLEVLKINNFSTTYYKNLNEKIDSKFDLYIVDGPFGSDKFSRYNIISLIDDFNQDSEFIILVDDYDRQGEKDTVNDIISFLKSKKIVFYTEIYKGLKSQIIIASEKYKFSTSF
jgi:hypothetical protein